MTNNNTRAFLSLLQAGLWEKDIQIVPYGKIDYSEVKRMADEQSVLGLIAAGFDHVSDTKVLKKDVIQIVVRESDFPVAYRGEYHYRTGSTKQQLTGFALTQFLFHKMHLSWDGAETVNRLSSRKFTFKRLKYRFEQRVHKEVKNADLVICDSKNIRRYIQKEYKRYNPPTCYIAYGTDTTPSTLADDSPVFTNWLKDRGLEAGQYYLVVGRFVPENNYEIMIREFMKSSTRKKFAIITTADDKFLNRLENKLHFKEDERICFAGTVYDQDLLRKIRENAYCYMHGHEVGGTNPSLLEALSSTKLNLLLNVGFNREVGRDAALYWTKEDGDLAQMIDRVDSMSEEKIEEFGRKAKARIAEAYSWDKIVRAYEKIFLAPPK